MRPPFFDMGKGMLAWGIPSFNQGIHEFRLISIVEA